MVSHGHPVCPMCLLTSGISFDGIDFDLRVFMDIYRNVADFHGDLSWLSLSVCGRPASPSASVDVHGYPLISKKSMDTIDNLLTWAELLLVNLSISRCHFGGRTLVNFPFYLLRPMFPDFPNSFVDVPQTTCSVTKRCSWIPFELLKHV